MQEQPAWKVTLQQHIKNNWFAWAYTFAAVVTLIAAALEGNLGKIAAWVPFVTLFAYIIFIFFIEYPKEKQLHKIKHLPLVYKIDVEWKPAVEAFEKGKQAITKKTGFRNFKLLEDRYNVHLDDLLFYTRGELGQDERRWNAFIMRSYFGMQTISSNLPAEKMYHVMLPMTDVTSLLGIGSLFGTELPVVLYQQFDNDYYPVIDLSSGIREKLWRPDEKAEEYINCEEQVEGVTGKEIAIVFQLSGQLIAQDVENYLRRKLSIRQINITDKYGGNLGKNDNWLEVLKQLTGKLKSLQDEGATRFHIFPNMPAALIFGLGMAFGRGKRATIYEWFPQSEEGYYPVYNLEDLRRYL